MTPEQREELKAAASNATPGQWLHRYDPGNPVGVQHGVKLKGEHGAWVADCLDNADRRSDVTGVAGERNAAYIALANPEAILSLIAQVEALTEQLDFERQCVIDLNNVLSSRRDEREKLLNIIASAYQIAGAHDASELVLDVLSDPLAATDMQIEELLPYQVEALTVPQGWKLVPVEPTREMVLAGAKHTTPPEDDETTGLEAYYIGLGRAACAYLEMLNAAPTIPAIPGTKEDAPTLPYCANSYDDEKVVCDECNLTLGHSRMLAAWTLAKAGVLRYTCIGKGGAYEVIGDALGAGALKSSGRVRVYRDAVTGGLFYRTLRDFDARMELVKEDAT